MLYNIYKYSLARGGRKLTCPNCDRPRCFKPYICNETGEVLNPKVGRCDHEQSCKYHYTPHDFFSDHPEAADRPWQHTGQRVVTPKNVQQAALSYVQQVFFDDSWPKKAAARPCTFKDWMKTLGYESSIIDRVLADYLVGGTAQSIMVDGVNYGPAAIFWMIDEEMHVHDAKLIAYQSDGHRVQGWANTMRSICIKSGIGPQLEQTEKVFFGLHLLHANPKKVVCIVESEKTALVCACRYPQFLWMATGGCGNLNAQKLKPLMSRRLVIYPDSGEYDKWEKIMRLSGHQDYRLVDFVEQYEPNTDIADILLNSARLKIRPAEPEPCVTESRPATEVIPAMFEPIAHYESPWTEMKMDNPALAELEQAFDLTMSVPTEKCPF